MCRSGQSCTLSRQAPPHEAINLVKGSALYGFPGGTMMPSAGPEAPQKSRHSGMSWGTRGKGSRGIRASLGLPGSSVMPGWRRSTPLAAEIANEDDRADKHRKQDEDFCRAVRAAVHAGQESCPLGVSTEPGTKNPISHYRPPE